eukprot:1850299-Ditylum_brightwellii.AAC.1
MEEEEIGKINNLPVVNVESNFLSKLIDSNYVLLENKEKVHLSSIPRTKQKIASESILNLVLTKLSGPSESCKIPTRQDIVL